MSDVIALARSGREKLARGLAVLQTPGLPTPLVEAAAPVAQAMGLLHQIESSAAPPAHVAPQALQAVRSALGALQGANPSHPAVDEAIASVAGSLNLVHSMTQLAGQAPQAGSPAQPNPSMQPAPANSVSNSQIPMPTGYRRSSRPPEGVAIPLQRPSNRAPHATANPEQVSSIESTAGFSPAASPKPRPQAVAAAAAPPAAVPPAAVPLVKQVSEPPQQPPQARAQPSAPEPSEGVLVVEAALGAHSTTNFYKGLSGNDVVDSGGIFIATYNIPDLAQDLHLKVSMPGGYEFEARGTVKWCRDAPKSASTAPDAPPGYGVQFTDISQEARQLVYRYVRNREPLFHDDL